MSAPLQHLNGFTTKTVYLTGVPVLCDWAKAMVPSDMQIINNISEADILLVLDAGNWLGDETVLADINNAVRADKPWALLRFGLVDLFGVCNSSAANNVPRRRRVKRSY